MALVVSLQKTIII